MESLHTAMEVVDKMRARPDYAHYAPRVTQLCIALRAQLEQDGHISSPPFLLGMLNGVLQSRHALVLHGLESHVAQDTLVILATALSEILIDSTEPKTM